MLKYFKNKVENIAIESIRPIISPLELKQAIPSDRFLIDHVENSRGSIANILSRRDKRLLLVVGPCSIHDQKSALDYAKRLSLLAKEVSDFILVVMRVYFEKPRTSIGWKGLINDPDLDNSCDINKGLHRAREILSQINKMGLPVAVEFLDPITPEYIADLISWGAIGARTTESQIHRSLASGLSMPIGFKNCTSGDTSIAVDAIYAASFSNQFLGITNNGSAAIIKTKGNKNTHIILRGGSHTGPNYSKKSIEKVLKQFEAKGIKSNIMIDCSHDNSGKDYRQQSKVLNAVMQQLEEPYADNIIGMMLESYIKEGSQSLSSNNGQLEYGKSITDSCISWQETEVLLLKLAEYLREVRFKSNSYDSIKFKEATF